MSGIVVAGTHSGCGKTTITLGLMAALRKIGLQVQPFKSGPDFIDTGLHGLVTGRPSRNLDLWMCGDDYVRSCFNRHSLGADISVVEGVMGLYDGSLSTAAVAACLNIPVVLVLDAYGMAETAGAIVNGMREMSRAPQFAGVIFNRVASESHYKRLKASIIDIPVLGYLPRDLSFEIPHRHLGLTTAGDNPITQENIARLADAVLTHIDIDELLRESKLKTRGSITLSADRVNRVTSSDKKIRLAVAYDRAFCFYYEDNLDLLREAGAELVFFSPLEDSQLPVDIDGIYIGGGYPELHAGQLSQNRSMLNSVRNWAESGRSMYAECGGLMYLSKGIRNFDDQFFSMANVYPFETRMKKGRSRLGYRQVVLKQDCLIGKKGAELRGHEFHYSEITDREALPGTGYSLLDGSGLYLHDEGYQYGRTLSSYIHIHFGSNPAIAVEFVNSCNNKR